MHRENHDFSGDDPPPSPKKGQRQGEEHREEIQSVPPRGISTHCSLQCPPAHAGVPAAYGKGAEVDLIDLHVSSVCGPVREENEDAALAWRGEEGTFALVVSDGMGGHSGGREAAQTVVRGCLEAIKARADEPWDEILATALRSAHKAVGALRHELEEQRGGHVVVGATAVVALIDGSCRPPLLHVAHVGDSRAYLYRGTSLYRLTDDHSLVAQLVRDGFLSEEEAFGHPDSNVIQQAVGQSAALEPELHPPLPLEPNDLLLLCSDGLHGVLQDWQIAAELRQSRASAAALCETLVSRALASGSEDNVSVACARLPDRPTSRRPTRVDS